MQTSLHQLNITCGYGIIIIVFHDCGQILSIPHGQVDIIFFRGHGNMNFSRIFNWGIVAGMLGISINSWWLILDTDTNIQKSVVSRIDRSIIFVQLCSLDYVSFIPRELSIFQSYSA